MRDLSPFDAALAAIDAANADDPSSFDGEPLALHEGRIAHRWVNQLDPVASEPLQLAARAHHLRRWALARSTYPDGRAGYLRWRRDQKQRHADELASILAGAGYDDHVVQRAAEIVAKRGLESDAEVQSFEDAVALTFMQTQVESFHDRLDDDDKFVDVVRKTLAKMTDRGRSVALTLEFDEPVRSLVTKAATA